MKTASPKRVVDGLLLLDKPAGLSSNAALQRAKRALGARKAGHTGTLDPLATGLLPIAFGEATKFAQVQLDAAKGYRAVVRFGERRSTGDAEGEVVETGPLPADRATIEAALERFRGPQFQVPPRHAALKHQGRAYYDYARAGIEIERKPRPVVIHALDLLDWRSPDATIDVACSKGTYVRVLAEDLGAACGSCAHLAGLRRTASGGFSLDGAIALGALEALDPAARDARLLPVERLVHGMPRVDLDAEAAGRFAQGRTVEVPAADGRCAVFAAGRLMGLADVSGRRLVPARLVATAAAGGDAGPVAGEGG